MRLCGVRIKDVETPLDRDHSLFSRLRLAGMIMLSESKDAADAHILGGHLGNMLIMHITIPNTFLC